MDEPFAAAAAGSRRRVSLGSQGRLAPRSPFSFEPWVSLLETEAGGKVLVEEPEPITTLLVTHREFLDTRRDIVQKFVAAHEELTEWDHQESPGRAAAGA
jgi:hypothetical protein